MCLRSSGIPRRCPSDTNTALYSCSLSVDVLTTERNVMSDRRTLCRLSIRAVCACHDFNPAMTGYHSRQPFCFSSSFWILRCPYQCLGVTYWSTARASYSSFVLPDLGKSCRPSLCSVTRSAPSAPTVDTLYILILLELFARDSADARRAEVGLLGLDASGATKLVQVSNV